MDDENEQDAGRQSGAERLGSLLQELAQTHGRVQAAELLGVNYRTLARSLESGELSATMRQALARYIAELPDDGEPSVDGTLPGALTTDGPRSCACVTESCSRCVANGAGHSYCIG